MPLGTPREKIEQERRKLEQMLREKRHPLHTPAALDADPPQAQRQRSRDDEALLAWLQVTPGGPVGKSSSWHNWPQRWS